MWWKIVPTVNTVGGTANIAMMPRAGASRPIRSAVGALGFIVPPCGFQVLYADFMSGEQLEDLKYVHTQIVA